MMDNIKLRSGDIFCTSFPGALNSIILRHEKSQSKDNQAEMGHAGIIIDDEGTTFEALWTYRHQNVRTKYIAQGAKVVVGRHISMTAARFAKGYGPVRRYKGKVYPVWRLPLHMIPGLAKRLSVGPAVCSELAMRFLYFAGLARAWKGWNPDDVADMIVRDKMWRVIYHQNIESYAKEYLDIGGAK